MRVGVVAVDGTKVHANASERATRDYEQIAREILKRPPRSTRPRTSSSANGGAMSSRRRSRRARAASAGCAMRADGWISGAPRRPGRSHARARSDSPRRAVGSTKSSLSSGARTPNTRYIERAG
jgi:hypothetical protein